MSPFIWRSMRSEQDIKDLKKTQKDLYDQTREQQKIDQTYIDDTFMPEAVKPPHQVLRLGLGSEIVNAPAEQIVTANPQAFVEVLKGTDEATGRISKVINDWIDVLRRQNPNPFKESVKNKQKRGENYIKFSYNEDWDKDLPYSMPIHFTLHDPMVIYGSLSEDVNGIPDIVLVIYERQKKDVVVRYPGKLDERGEEKTVQWFEFYDKDTVQFEAKSLGYP